MVTFNSKFELILTQLQATLYNRATFECQHMPSCFWAKLACRKITCTKFLLRMMTTLHRPFICSQDDKYISSMSCVNFLMQTWVKPSQLHNNPVIKYHRYVSQGHPPNHIVHPFARILQIINNTFSNPYFRLLKKFISGRSYGLRFGLTYIDETKHRLLREMQYNMINIVAGCLLCQFFRIVMSKYMNNFKANQGKFCIQTYPKINYE